MSRSSTDYARFVATYAYPCSVESGFDFNCVVRECIEHNNVDALQKIMGSPTPPTNDEAQLWANEQNNLYTFSVEEDLTMMKSDFGMIVSNPLMSKLCSESRDTGISHLKNNLEDPTENSADTFFILSHAIDQSFVEHFKKADSQPVDGKLEGWKYRIRCDKALDLGNTDSEIFENAEQGDLVVFDYGFLSPKWLMKRIRERDAKQVKSSVLVVLDSCFSGAWVKYCGDDITNTPLIHTTFAIQASCSGSEVSFGNSFIPSFLEFQSMSETAGILAPETAELRQHPEYFSSVSESSMISCKSKQWKLMDAKDFENVVHMEISEVSRVKDLSEAQTVLNNARIIHVDGYQLTKTKDGNPMAMILVNYNSLTYEVHVHYRDGISCEPTGVSVMDMKTKTMASRYLYETVPSEKFRSGTDTTCVESAKKLLKDIIPHNDFTDLTKWTMTNYADSTLARIACRSRMKNLKLIISTASLQVPSDKCKSDN